MKAFSVTASIRATPEHIWPILTDAARYPDWNTTVTKIEGTIAAGERITVHAAMNSGRTFPLEVSMLNAATQMIWSGGMPFGLFQGKRTFTLHLQDAGQVKFPWVKSTADCCPRLSAGQFLICSPPLISSPTT
jgi:uncharacterized protein YndB with AHSA1/START domain